MTIPNIRRATHNDAKALAACIDAAYAIYARRISDLPNVSEGIDDDIKNNIVYVAEQGDMIVGGLVLSAQRGFMLLMNIAVHPNAAGLGIGRALMDKADAETLERGLSEMRLSTHVEMPENVALYEHLGWREAARSGRKVQMKKSLN